MKSDFRRDDFTSTNENHFHRGDDLGDFEFDEVSPGAHPVAIPVTTVPCDNVGAWGPDTVVECCYELSTNVVYTDRHPASVWNCKLE